MSKCFLCLVLFVYLVIPTSALEIEAPIVPDSGAEWMPEDTESFSDGFFQLLRNVFSQLRPDLSEASKVCVAVLVVVITVSLLRSFTGQTKQMAELVGTTTIFAVLLHSANSMLHLASQTIQELSDYGKLLFPVMTTAMAAQGQAVTSASLYVGAVAFHSILSSLIAKYLLPMVYLYLAAAAAASALKEDTLKKMRDFIKNVVSWLLKTLLTVFTAYMSITGVVSGTTDAAALKATKVTISSVVPIVGGILSDASEAVLVGTGMIKNAAGIYGILAVLAVFLEPFLRIGCHYLVLKVTSAVCCVFSGSGMTGFIEDSASAMGLLLAMTGSVCMLLLISTVCFLKGAG